MFSIFICSLGIMGGALVALGIRRTAWWGHVIWVVSDIGLIGYNLYIHELPQAIMFLVYLVISIIGVFRWRKKK